MSANMDLMPTIRSVHMFWLMVRFFFLMLYFVVRPTREGHSQNVRPNSSNHLVLGPLFWIAPPGAHHGTFYRTHKF
jgi:hypothetical protein